MTTKMTKINIGSLIHDEKTGEQFEVVAHKGLDHIVRPLNGGKRLVLNQLILKKYYKKA